MRRPLSTDLFVRPLEPLFFGPPRSLNAGEDHTGDGSFPPTPRTFQGLIRTQLLYRVEPRLDLNDRSPAANAAREAMVGTGEHFPDRWQLKGPLPAEIKAGQLEPWAPTPFFLHSLSNSQRSPLFPEIIPSTQAAMDDRTPAIDPSVEWVGLPHNPQAEPLKGWLSPSGLRWALNWGRKMGDQVTQDFTENDHATPLPPFVQRQPQTGIKRERSNDKEPDRRREGLAEDGMIYTHQAVRFDDKTGFWGSLRIAANSVHPIHPERLPDNPWAAGLGQTGRKARLVAFVDCPPLHPDWVALLEGEHLVPIAPAEEDYFWLYALTPVALSERFGEKLPGGVSWRRPDTVPPGVTLRSIAAFTGAPQTIGGWNMASTHWRPNQSYAPAGSVWLVQLKGGSPADRRHLLQALNNSHALGSPEEAVLGFGHILVGLGPRKS